MQHRLAALIGLFATAMLATAEAPAGTVFHASFDSNLSAVGAGAWQVGAGAKYESAPGRLNAGLKLPAGAGPVVYDGGKLDLAGQGGVYFWLGSLDAKGYEKKAVNLLAVRGEGTSLQFYIGGDGFLYAVRRTGGKTQAWRYPIYDLLPKYEGFGRGGPGADVRHFIALQWGPKDAGLTVNAVAGEALDRASAAPAAPAAGDHTIALGDAGAGLIFDELLVTDSPKTDKELRDLYVSFVTGSYQLPLPEITVNRHRGKRIVIDGDMTEEEWGSAAALGAPHLVDSMRLVPYDTKFYFTYDAERFYVAMRTYADYPLHAIAGPRDANHENFGVCMDDCFELLLMPYESINYDYFHFLGNSKDFYADQVGTDGSWNGRWEFRNQVKDGVWTAEIAIPYDSLATADNKARYPANGQKWRFNVTRNWDGVLEDHWCNICFLHSYGDFWKFAQMSFQESGLSPRFEGISQEGDEIIVRIQAMNTSDKPAGVTAYATAFEQILPFSEAKVSATVPAGGRKDLEVRLPLKGRKAASIEWGLTAADGGAYLLRGAGKVPFAEGHAEEYRKRLADEAAARQKLEGAKPTQPQAEKPKDAPKPKADDTILWPTREALDAALAKRQQWKNNDIGYSDKVPPPWTPVTVEKAKIGVWGRQYDFTGSLILGQVQSNGQDLLAGPVALVVQAGGKTTRYEKAVTTVTARCDRKVELIAVGGDDRLTISAETFVEFDGCVWTELRLNPAAGPVAFDRMWLEVPLLAEQAPCYSWWIDKESGSRAGRIPAGGVSDTFRPYVWAGDVDRGLCWWIEELREWFIAEPETTKMTFLEPDGKVMRMRIVIADRPGRLEQTLRTEFGLMATPVRPMPKNWRLYDHYCGWGKLKGQFSNWGTGYFVKEPDDPNDMRDRLRRYYDANPYIIPTPNCGSYFYTETNYKDGRRLADSWLWQPEFGLGNGRGTARTRQVWKDPGPNGKYQVGYTTACPSREYTDLYLFNYNKLMGEFPLLRGIYMDTCIPYADNPLNDTGYTDRFGRRRQTPQIMASREFMKRLYTMFWHLRGDPGENPWVIYTHCSNQICPPIHAFSTSMLQGEGVSVEPRALGDRPLNALTLDGLRVAFCGHPYGWIEQFLGYYNSNPEVQAEMAAMFLLHDHNVLGRMDLRTGARMSQVLQSAGLRCADDEVIFLPYWAKAPAAASRTAGAYADAYVKTKEGRTILLVVSLAEQNAPVFAAFDLDRAKLHLPADGALEIRDLYTGESWTLPPAKPLELPIRRNDFRMLEIKPAK